MHFYTAQGCREGDSGSLWVSSHLCCPGCWYPCPPLPAETETAQAVRGQGQLWGDRQGRQGTTSPRPLRAMSPLTTAPLQASQETLLAAAEFLKWNQLGYLTQTLQTWRIGECLVRASAEPL